MYYSKKLQRILESTVVILVFLTTLATPSFAVETETALLKNPVVEIKTEALHPDRINEEYLKGALDDTGRMAASPVSWDTNDWLTTGFVAGAATGLYLADTDIRDSARRHQSGVGDGFAKIGNAIGNPLIIVPSLGLVYLYGHIEDDSKARKTALLGVESVAISGALAMTLKLATQRPRPFTGESSKTWDGPSLKSLDPAFPSIHTQSAFAAASVIADEYSDNRYVAPIAYSLATLTGISRIYTDKHWASDVFVGAAIGYFTGKAVVRYHTQSSNSALKILPTVSQQGVGIMAEYRF